ncbi:MAG: hypothetical protein C5B49_04850 [Bdellovibrio sp.]|nr:MAG: hypothetical protein C5B49_04850 [Bdellovibrio sp.]
MAPGQTRPSSQLDNPRVRKPIRGMSSIEAPKQQRARAPPQNQGKIVSEGANQTLRQSGRTLGNSPPTLAAPVNDPKAEDDFSRRSLQQIQSQKAGGKVKPIDPHEPRPADFPLRKGENSQGEIGQNPQDFITGRRAYPAEGARAVKFCRIHATTSSRF